MKCPDKDEEVEVFDCFAINCKKKDTCYANPLRAGFWPVKNKGWVKIKENPGKGGGGKIE